MGMRLKDFLPDIVNRDAKLIESNKLLNTMYENGFMNFMKSRYGGNIKSATQEFGIEQL